MSARLQVRVVSPWFGGLETDEVVCSTKISLEKADALLCDWAPSPELLTFPRTKAWYCCEPITRRQFFREQNWEKYVQVLSNAEFLNHWNLDPNYRVCHITHFQRLECNLNTDRLNKAIALVSNAGPPPWRRSGTIGLRTAFCTQPGVDLYGRRSGWASFRRHLWSRPSLPSNYVGALPGDWSDPAKKITMSRYKVAVCLENSFEPHYFTEKFVGAVEAGCIPVYHAQETLVQGVLKGARWVDPARFGFEPKATLEFALGERAEPYWEANSRWLQTEALQGTHSDRVYARIMAILANEVRKFRA